MLAHDYGLEVAHADEEVDATAADARTGELLGLQRGAPYCESARSFTPPMAGQPSTCLACIAPIVTP